MNTRQLSDRASAELETLTDQGITPTWAEVVEINHLSWLTQSPTNEMASARGEPMRIPGAVLWPFTLQAGNEWDRIAEWFDGVDDNAKAIGFLMAHGRRSCLRVRLASRDAARRAVFSWAKRLPCTQGELNIATAAVLAQMKDVENEVPKREGQADDDDVESTSMELVSYLALNTGLEADYWERKVCIPYINEQIRAIVRQGLTDDKPQKDDPRIIAERNLAYAIMTIEKRG
jgi:hypothetical protein